ncbi:histone H3-like centromeric protein cid [Drosophila obscura]|uniref:histone H3-like centromeric protein cid n=1 Tax=Drosophila obscura TaxID=7282 RepID=UPI001BB1A399|nr:histone H3-like centromeric protein cid [Drosophila obscura]
MRPPAKNTGGRRASNVPKPTLGDSDTDTENDSTAFQSPDDENATDYGLEFTTSRLNLQDSNNRRTSTLRKDTSAAARRARENEESSDEENRPPEPAVRPGHNTSNRSLRSANPPPPQQSRPTRQAQQARATGAPRRKQTRPVSRALQMQREIKRLQSLPSLLIPRLPFARLVRELIMNFTGSTSPFKVTTGSLEALQTAAEMYITQRFQDAYLLTLHRSRVTLEVRDMALMAFLCGQGRIN